MPKSFNPSLTSIRLAIIEDACTISAIHVKTWQQTYHDSIPIEILSKISIKERAKKWAELIANNTRIFVIEYADKIIGFGSVCSSRDPDADPIYCGEVSSLYIDPNFWGGGLGKKLLIYLINQLEILGFTEVTLWVLKDNINAQKFYEAMGFREDEKERTEVFDVAIEKEKTIKYAEIKMNEIRYYKKIKA